MEADDGLGWVADLLGVDSASAIQMLGNQQVDQAVSAGLEILSTLYSGDGDSSTTQTAEIDWRKEITAENRQAERMKLYVMAFHSITQLLVRIVLGKSLNLLVNIFRKPSSCVFKHALAEFVICIDSLPIEVWILLLPPITFIVQLLLSKRRCSGKPRTGYAVLPP
jgi:hypothetical protein